jgi:hypothetical protein
MWRIKYTEEGKIKTFESDVKGGILSAIEDFYSKFKWKSIVLIECV